ncbi:hypothetical protein ABT024_12670 [Streptomyces sp. NPDC002812]|uniref:hypothetical protein n=1 Tax=Streptomyces sp. NPDC002812 TaxID=3154434 RepID=UPI0033334C4B
MATVVALWVVKAGVNGERSAEALERGVASFNAYTIAQDAASLPSGTLADLLHKRNTRREVDGEIADMQTCRSWARQMRKLIHKIKKGDWIVMPTGKQGEQATAYSFGRVSDPYRYVGPGKLHTVHDRYAPTIDEVMAHARPVTWSTPVHATHLEESGLTEAIHRLGTVYQPSAQEALIAFAQGVRTS